MGSDASESQTPTDDITHVQLTLGDITKSELECQDPASLSSLFGREHLIKENCAIWTLAGRNVASDFDKRFLGSLDLKDCGSDLDCDSVQERAIEKLRSKNEAELITWRDSFVDSFKTDQLTATPKTDQPDKVAVWVPPSLKGKISSASSSSNWRERAGSSTGLTSQNWRNPSPSNDGLPSPSSASRLLDLPSSVGRRGSNQRSPTSTTPYLKNIPDGDWKGGFVQPPTRRPSTRSNNSFDSRRSNQAETLGADKGYKATGNKFSALSDQPSDC